MGRPRLANTWQLDWRASCNIRHHDTCHHNACSTTPTRRDMCRCIETERCVSHRARQHDASNAIIHDHRVWLARLIPSAAGPFARVLDLREHLHMHGAQRRSSLPFAELLPDAYAPVLHRSRVRGEWSRWVPKGTTSTIVTCGHNATALSSARCLYSCCICCSRPASVHLP
jgi:hypothetical protein